MRARFKVTSPLEGEVGARPLAGSRREGGESQAPGLPLISPTPQGGRGMLAVFPGRDRYGW